ncbi:palmitoyltransferase ZDHHC23-A isoform X3 [Xyrauchen texanus]|uniref:palmitoyltransferase ZDHHC23-A isoform X3 n=1 Tax=Xyrauchen texanus TaxID=154827 RepID=UPI00224295C4|nr:palmitoyltransferase ZDHHC23-A isoform X3 [Xyrauchen texanus]XP_051949257.1 palmitoyltransferase ZDHHC23-A isoform X3 [Xyrauchen texanus]
MTLYVAVETSTSKESTAAVKNLMMPVKGPLRLELSVLPPMVLLPGLLRVAAINCVLGVVTLTALPGLVLWYYYVTHKRKRRTLFFLSLALFSLAYMYYLFLTEILPRGDVSSLQVVTATTGMLLTLISLVRTKQGPGFVNSHSLALNSSSTTNQSKNLTQDSTPCNGINQSKGKIEEKKKWCPVCRLVRPPRAGHCRICGTCVLRMDHHCVWINSCVGQANHRQFLLTLLLFLLTSFYGISLVLRSICPHQSIFTAMLYCPGVYNQYSKALCFTCVWYSSIITGGLLYLFILQIINVSNNVTEREAQIALRNKSGRRRYFGLVVETGIYTQGFRQNWIQFLTMNTDENGSPLTFTDMV